MDILWKDRKRTFLGLPWSFTKYSITNDRLFIQTGFFTLKEDEVRLYRVMDITLKRGFGQRLLGLGTIDCCSADKTLKDFQLKNIKKSKEVKELISKLVEEERTTKRVSNRELLGTDCDDEDDDTDTDHL